jgi:hypothetical protein
MKALAIKRGQIREKTEDVLEMGTLRCDQCGEEFSLVHNSVSADRSLAERQAYWLEKVLAEEHERDKKHPDRIDLPD